MNNPKITKIDIHQFEWESENLGLDYNQFNLVYTPGSTITRTGHVLQIHAAEGFGLDVELHGGGPAQHHCMASIRNTNWYELGLVHPKAPASSAPVTDYPDTLGAIDEHGCVPVPDGPGLGVTYDWDFIEAHRTGLKSYE